MIVKELLEAAKEEELLKKVMEVTTLPEEIVSSRSARRKAEKKMNKEYKKVFKAILKLNATPNGEVLTKSEDAFYVKDQEVDLRYMDWIRILGMEFNPQKDDDLGWILRYMTWYFKKYSDCKKELEKCKICDGEA